MYGCKDHVIFRQPVTESLHEGPPKVIFYVLTCANARACSWASWWQEALASIQAAASMKVPRTKLTITTVTAAILAIWTAVERGFWYACKKTALSVHRLYLCSFYDARASVFCHGVYYVLHLVVRINSDCFPKHNWMVSITKMGAFRERQKFRIFTRRALSLSCNNHETQIFTTVTLFDTFKVIQPISDSDNNFTFSKDESF